MSRIWIIWVGMYGVGCTDRSSSEAWMRFDSAGIQVVVSDPSAVEWSGELDQILSLGSIGGGGAEEFFQVRDIVFLDSLTFAVADAGSEEVRLFSLDGRHLGSFGSPGRGPTEFRGLQMIRRYGDSVLTYDGGNDRIGVRNPAGDLLRSFRLEWFGGALFPVDLSSSGEIVAITARRITELGGTGRVVDTSLVSLYDLDGALIDSVARLPHNERFVKQVGDLRTTVGAPFTASASVVSVDSGFCHAFGPFPEVRCYDISGDPTRVARIRLDPRLVGEADVDRYWETVWAEAEGPYRAAMQRVRRDITFPTYFPAISSLLVDDDARLWARQFRPFEEGEDLWWIFDSSRLVGEVVSPGSFDILDVGSGLVGGVWRDEFGVEHVRIYRLTERHVGS